jgi:site-specific DNA recombinase
VHRPKALFSGLVFCGVCGSPYSIRGQNSYACSAQVGNGSCTNSRSIDRAKLEERTLAGLKDRMMAPEVAEEAMRAYAEETNRFNRERRANSENWRTELVKVEKAIAAMISAIEEGLYQPSMKARMEELERQKADLMDRLAGVPADVPDILPNVCAVYRKKVQRLAAALNDPREQAEAAEAIRALIERITLRPGPNRGEVDATLHGELGTIMRWIGAQPIGTNKRPTFIGSADPGTYFRPKSAMKLSLVVFG